MKRLIASGLTRVAKLFDDAVPAGDIQEFLGFEIGLGVREALLSERARQDLHVARSLLLDSDAFLPPSISLNDALAWKQRLGNSSVVTRGVVAQGSGAALYALEVYQAERTYVDCSLELLIRHIEVKRKGSLRIFTPRVAADHAWLERHDIALLLIAAAQKRGDLRFLNTALKLNDWAYRQYHARPTASEPRMRYLLALALQESVMRIVACA